MKLNFTITGKVITTLLISIITFKSGISQSKEQLSALTVNSAIQINSEVVNGAVTISWAAGNSFTNSDFVIERSFDQSSFKAVCYFMSADKADLTDAFLHFKDKSAELAGKSRAYYRIRQTEKDGTVNYSDLVTVTLK